LNALDRDACTRCGTHLYTDCPHCGARTDRVHSRCTACGKALPDSPLSSWKKGVKSAWGKLRVEQILFLLIAILLGFIGIVFFTQMSSSGGK